MLFIGFSPPLDKYATKIPKAIAPVRQRQLQQTSAWLFRKPRRWPWRETGTKSFRRRCLFNERTLLIFKVDFWNFLWCKFAAFTFTQKNRHLGHHFGFQPIRSPKKGASNLPELLGCNSSSETPRFSDDWMGLTSFLLPPPLEKSFPVVFFHAYHLPRSPLLNWRGSWVCSARRGAPRCGHTTNPPFWAPKSLTNICHFFL